MVRKAAGLQPLDYSGNVYSDYANTLDNRRSVTGYTNFPASRPVTLQSKTLVSLAISTMPAEYMVLAAMAQGVEMQQFLHEELGLTVLQPIITGDMLIYHFNN